MKKKIIALIATLTIVLPGVNTLANQPGMQIKTKAETTTSANQEKKEEVKESNSSPSSNSSNAGQGSVKFAIPQDLKGEKVSDEEAIKVLEESANVMATIESYDMSMITSMNVMNQDILTESKGQMFPQKREAALVTTVQGQETKSYMKDGKMYSQNPQNGEWMFTSLGDMPENKKEKITIDSEVLNFVTVEKTQDGYILKTNEKVGLEEITKAFPNGSDSNGAEELKKTLGEGTEIKSNVFIVTDKEYRYKEMYYDMDTTLDGQTFNTLIKYAYSNFNKAKEVELPEEVKKAKEIKIDAAPQEETKTTVEGQDTQMQTEAQEEAEAEETTAEETIAE